MIGWTFDRTALGFGRIADTAKAMAKKPVQVPLSFEETVLGLRSSPAPGGACAPAAWESAQGLHRRRYARALEEIDALAGFIAQDIAGVLAEHVDELSTSHREFRVSMLRVVTRVLRTARSRPQAVLVFNEVIPGFTVMLFKKDSAAAAWAPLMAPENAAPSHSAAPELAAAGAVIAQFVHRTGSRVLTVEADDALFVFFPASDVKKNLKEMGFYHTD